MVVLYTTLIVLVCLLVFFNTYSIWFKKRSKATMYDVRHLLMEGEKEAAIRVYCEIFQTTPLKAKKDIEELERSLKV